MRDAVAAVAATAAAAIPTTTTAAAVMWQVLFKGTRRSLSVIPQHRHVQWLQVA